MDAVVASDVASWLFQLIASLCWIASVIAFGEWESGDIWSLMGGVSWAIANLVALEPPECLSQTNYCCAGSVTKIGANGPGWCRRAHCQNSWGAAQRDPFNTAMTTRTTSLARTAVHAHYLQLQLFVGVAGQRFRRELGPQRAL